jgi:site-specific DNA-cytosine methylase
MAGKRKGKDDERHLWPEMLRCIREVKPRWVIGENVLGLVNWSGGLVFHEVQADLEAEGYEVFPYVLPAVSVNAPHRRDRVWFVAHSNNSRNSSLRCGTDGNWKAKSTKREQSQYEFNRQSNTGIKHGHSEKYWDNRIGKRQMDIAMWNAQTNGKTSQLSPQFVMEMMGFPTDWTELPFLNGEKNQSKQGETQ